MRVLLPMYQTGLEKRLSGATPQMYSMKGSSSVGTGWMGIIITSIPSVTGEGKQKG